MDRLDAMAQHMWEARRARRNFANLAEELKPATIAEAYRAQEVYHRLAEPVYGPVAGVKVADHHQGDAAIDGDHAPLRRRDLCPHDPHVTGAHRKERLHQPARRERNCAQARAGYALREGAVDRRERSPVRFRRDAGLRADRGPQCGLYRDASYFDDRGKLLERRRGDRRAESGQAGRRSSASPDARR